MEYDNFWTKVDFSEHYKWPACSHDEDRPIRIPFGCLITLFLKESYAEAVTHYE